MYAQGWTRKRPWADDIGAGFLDRGGSTETARPKGTPMSQATARCDQIISLIDRCLAECELPLSVVRRASSDHPGDRAAQAA
jgi:hypothetical protein